MFLKDFKEQHAKYIESEHWHGIRDQAFELYGKQCMICGTEIDLHVHHLIYHIHNLRLTTVEEVRVLCNYHHDTLHKLMKKKVIIILDEDSLAVREEKTRQALEPFKLNPKQVKLPKLKVLDVPQVARRSLKEQIPFTRYSSKNQKPKPQHNSRRLQAIKSLIAACRSDLRAGKRIDHLYYKIQNTYANLGRTDSSIVVPEEFTFETPLVFEQKLKKNLFW